MWLQEEEAKEQSVNGRGARFLRPWEILEVDIQYLKQESQDGNRYLLVVVDRASKLLFAYPLPSKGCHRGKSQAVGTPPDIRGATINSERRWGGVHSTGGETLVPVAESVDRLRSC